MCSIPAVCLSIYPPRRSGDAAVIRAARRLGSGPHTHALLLAGADGRLHVGIQTIYLHLYLKQSTNSGSTSLL